MRKDFTSTYIYIDIFINIFIFTLLIHTPEISGTLIELQAGLMVKPSVPGSDP